MLDAHHRQLLSDSRRLLREAKLYSKLIVRATACNSCWPKAEQALAVKAFKRHARVMHAAHIPFSFTLIRGSAVHLPLLRQLVNHYTFTSECKVCAKQLSDFSDAIAERKTAPADVDLVTVGVSQDRVKDYWDLAALHHGPHSPVDFSSYLTDLQLRNPRFTHSSYFNLENMNIPHDPAQVNPKKFARHLASVAWFLHAYPVFAPIPDTRIEFVRRLRTAQNRFRRYLIHLAPEQLEEFNRILTWRLKKEAYSIFHIGGPKDERSRAIARYRPSEDRVGPWERDLLIHLTRLHLANRTHTRS